MKNWTTFHWENPNFLVRSIPDNELFKVERECLIAGSGVFRDMFATCESGYVVHMLDEDEETLDMPEPSSTLIMLFNFLHYPPEPYLEHRKTKELLGSDYDYTKIQPLSAPSEIIIPFPILPLLLRLSDKYRFTQENTTCLYSHLTAYASTYPLRVYGYAIELGLESVAAKTSIYLLHPPLSSYSPEDMKVIPTAEALQKLVRLHDYRIKKLGQVLDEEVVFPYGYGLCTKHGQKTKSLWNQRKHHLNPLIQAATDVAAEMGSLPSELKGCDVCSKAWKAAVEMLAYKCAKIPRRIDKIPV